MKKILLLIICQTLFSAFAQDIRTIQGRITGRNGEPLVEASIVEKNTNNVVFSGGNGEFKLKLRKDRTFIVISHVGYLKAEIPVVAGARRTLNIQLEDLNSLEQLVIVGSRNMTRSAVDTPSPIDVIDVVKVTSSNGQLDINQLLQFVVPSFNSNRQTGSDGADHIDPATLRGLGPDQTLVLINGKRRHQSSLVNLFGSRGRGNTGTDLNAIPAAAIERIEVLRDGAAAQYGSDAIAGVINIVLRADTKALEVNFNSGINQAQYRFDSKKFDGLNYNANANYGVKLGKTGGYLNLTGDYNFRGHTNRANTHPTDLARREYGDPQMLNSAAYFNFKIPLAEKLHFYSFGGINQRKGDAFAWTRFATDDRNIKSIYPNGFDPLISSDIQDKSVVAGVRFLPNNWDIDISNTFGSNRFHYMINNTLNASLGASSPTSFDAGGFSLSQNTVNFNMAKYFGKAFNGLNLAMGAEYRMEQYNIVAGEEKSWKSYKVGVPPGSQGFPGFQPSDETNQQRTNLGIFADTEIDLSKWFMIGGAIRFENYSDFGNTINGKLASRLKLGKSALLRGTYSTGFRAPSLPQRFFNSTITNFVNGVPVEVLIARNNGSISQKVGIEPLKQETSQNISFGLTLNPVSNFTLTVDAYQIKVKDRIVLTGQFSDNDNAIGTELKKLNVSKAQFFTNAVSTTTKGVDIVLAHRLKMEKTRLNTSFAMNMNELTIDAVNTNTKLKGKEDTYFDLREQYFLKASAPKSKINLTVDYGNERTNAVLRLVRFGEVKLANWNYDEKALDVYAPKITTDFSIGHKFAKNIHLTLGASNLLNVYPDMSTASLTESGGAWDPVQMGNNGRFIYSRLNFKF